MRILEPNARYLQVYNWSAQIGFAMIQGGMESERQNHYSEHNFQVLLTNMQIGWSISNRDCKSRRGMVILL